MDWTQDILKKQDQLWYIDTENKIIYMNSTEEVKKICEEMQLFSAGMGIVKSLIDSYNINLAQIGQKTNKYIFDTLPKEVIEKIHTGQNNVTHDFINKTIKIQYE